MVDNRSAGALGIGGGINFKSGDISGTAAKTSDDRASQGTEYFMQEGEEQQNSRQEPFVDRSMQLRASLNSLALLNVVSVLQNKRKNLLLDDEDYAEKIKSKKVQKIDKDKDEETKK
ncbi:TPA: hypothetical protein IAA87_02140 [Candidatus Avigastranaerophilus faecigallinarum]|nr:hypothetical protein [Candidatus Avigastranaerophilus faecigallinarum]